MDNQEEEIKHAEAPFALTDGLERMIKRAKEDEREACARECEKLLTGHRSGTADATRRMCAAAIRMRSNAIIQGLERSDSPAGMEG